MVAIPLIFLMTMNVMMMKKMQDTTNMHINVALTC